VTARQPLKARAWGGVYRTWFPDGIARQKRKAKRRSAKRERQRARAGIRAQL
jgi:hypothetical protein